MMRSLYSGVAGLKTHQVKMDVIGNNIANVNTVAYKSQSITFSELMYQTTQSASGPNETTGTAGTNAKQIGLGVKSGAISTAITQQGSTQTTGNAFDLRITGDSFFVVSDGTTNFFTRDGSFYVDAVGNLAMSSNGYNVMGWQVNKEGKIVQDNVSKLQIMSPENLTSDPEATTLATMQGIIDKNDPQVLGDGKVVNLSFYDNMGYSYTARMLVNGTDEEGNYVLSLADVLDSNNESISDKFDFQLMIGQVAASGEASKAASYSLGTGYTLSGTTVTLPNEVTLKDGTKITSVAAGDAFNADGTVKDKERASLYSSAFGFDDPEKFATLTIKDYTGGATAAPEVKSVTGMLVSGTTTYNKLNDAGDATVSTNMLETTAAGTTLSVGGYKSAAGKSLNVYYNQATGSITGVGGKTTESKAFNIQIKPKTDGDDNPFEVVSVDMTDSKNLNNEQVSTLSSTSGDKEGKGTGCALGTMTGVSIQNNGMIYGAYDNGQTKLLGQISTASFSNPAGLEKEGDNLYRATLNSGAFDGIGTDVTSDGGYVSAGVLEMSNVDLSSEFTELITTQRGFQANSRIITVSDTLLEELVNLKR
ncbi:MAG: Flagellar hook protein FlgE [Firmicutes bacterium ADurb.Bin354]|nr:MAG: Flagellar hook protein FlgE [Firmicutes bacterium ADurb.Bin354]